MGLGEVFTKTFDILKNNPRIIWPYFLFTILLSGIALIPTITGIGASGVTGLSSLQASGSGVRTAIVHALEAELPFLIVIIIIAFLLFPLIAGTYINIADQGYQKKIVSMSSAFAVAKANYVNLLLTCILVAVIWCVVSCVLGAVFLTPLVLLGLGAGVIVWLIIGAIVFIVVFVLLSIYLYQCYVVVILEKRKAVDAVKRSIQIGRQKLGDVFVVLLVTAIIVIAFSVVDSIIVGVIEFAVVISGSTTLGVALSQAVNVILSGIFGSWLVLIPVGFYKEYIPKKKLK